MIKGALIFAVGAACGLAVGGAFGLVTGITWTLDEVEKTSATKLNYKVQSPEVSDAG